MSVMPKCVKRFDEKINKSNFSIDHILNVAGEKQVINFQFSTVDADEDRKFEWLSCTRYKPPKLPRNRKKEGIQRRKLGRNPRIPFSSSQVAFLEAKFVRTPYLSSSDVTQIATYLQLSETRVKIWFQNRRARERRDKDSKFIKSEELTEKRISPELKNSNEINRRVKDATTLPLNYFHSLRYIDQNDRSFLPLIAPLDLSERQVICK